MGPHIIKVQELGT